MEVRRFQRADRPHFVLIFPSILSSLVLDEQQAVLFGEEESLLCFMDQDWISQCGPRSLIAGGGEISDGTPRANLHSQ